MLGGALSGMDSARGALSGIDVAGGAVSLKDVARDSCKGVAARAGDVVPEALAIMERRVTVPNSQSINGLWRESQLCPRTIEQDESSFVKKRVIEVIAPDGKRKGNSTASVMTLLEVPSNKRSVTGGIE